MRIAFVFVGHARTLDRSYVYTSIHDKLLGGFGRGCDYDVFWYFSEPTGWSNATNATLYRLFNPKRVAFAPIDAVFDPILPPLPNLTGVPSTFKFYDDPAAAIRLAATLFSRLQGAWRLLQGESYDWVVRARFDQGWYAALPPASTFPRDRVFVPIDTWNGLNDQFAMVPWHLASSFFDASAILKDNAWYREGDIWQPETLLWRSLTTRGIPFARHSVPAVVARSDGGSRCLTLGPLNVLATMWDAFLATDRRSLRNVVKRAHVAACATRLPCCQVDFDGETVVLDVAMGEGSFLRSACDPRGTCAALRRQLFDRALIADDDAVKDDLDVFETRYQALAARQHDVLLQINTSPDERRGEGPAAAARAADWVIWLVVSLDAARNVLRAMLCSYLALWPRAEIILATQTNLTGADCAGAPDYLAAAETWLHATVLDDAKLTSPGYATIASGALGWEVWHIFSDDHPDVLRFPTEFDTHHISSAAGTPPN